MKKIIPDLYIKVLNHEKEPVNGVVVSLIFKTSFKNNHSYILYKYSEIDRSYFLSGDEIIKDCYNTLNLFPMDYGHIEYHFTNEIEVTILSSKRISGVLEAYNIWKKGIKFPNGYKEDLEKAHVFTQTLEQNGIFNLLDVECKAVPDCVDFEVIKPS